MGMLKEKTVAKIQLILDDVKYQWEDNFFQDLKGLLRKLAGFNKQPVVEENDSFDSSYGSVFSKPLKNDSSYDLVKDAIEEASLNDEDELGPRLK